MSEENAQNLTDARSFEERVFARFDAMDRRFDAMDRRFDGVDANFSDLNARVERLEARSHDTKPMWEQALKEIMGTRQELKEFKREVTKRLDRVESAVLGFKSHLSDLEDRVEKLEAERAE